MKIAVLLVPFDCSRFERFFIAAFYPQRTGLLYRGGDAAGHVIALRITEISASDPRSNW